MLRKFISVLLILCLLGVLPLCAMADDIEVEQSAQQVRIPLVVDFANVIAGAQFTFSYTDGLYFVEYEQSDAVRSGVLTPVAEKDGAITLGFFSGDNIFEPQDGKLDMGCLVFDYTGQAQQSVTISAIKLDRVVDDNNTKSEFIEPGTINISRESRVPVSSGENSPANSADRNDDFNVWWLIAAVVIAAVVVFIIVFIRKKQNGGKASDVSEDGLL